MIVVPLLLQPNQSRSDCGRPRIAENRLQASPLFAACKSRRNRMRALLFIIVILLLVGALPMWSYSGGWGYYPSGGLGLLLLVLIVLAVVGVI
jgi:uncharacterized protein DUF3309